MSSMPPASASKVLKTALLVFTVGGGGFRGGSAVSSSFNVLTFMIP